MSLKSFYKDKREAYEKGPAQNPDEGQHNGGGARDGRNIGCA